MYNFEEYGAFKEDSDLNYVISPEENSLAEMSFFISWDKKNKKLLICVWL